MSPDQKTQKCKKKLYSLPRVLLQYAALKDTLVTAPLAIPARSSVRVSQTRTILANSSNQTFFLSQNVASLGITVVIMTTISYGLSMNEMYDWGITFLGI